MESYCSGSRKHEDDEWWKWYPIEVLADREDVSVRTIYRWLEKGKVEKRETSEGTRYRIPDEEYLMEEAEARQFPLEDHKKALDEATEEDEHWETLRGNLYESGWRKDEVCPDEISEKVADRYVITDAGRLFFLRKDGGISERKEPASGQYNLMVDGQRWQPRHAALVRRVFSSDPVLEMPEKSFARWDEMPPIEPDDT